MSKCSACGRDLEVQNEADRPGEDTKASPPEPPPHSESDRALDGATFEPGAAKESLSVAGDLLEIPLTEARAVKDGKVFIKLIQPGQGSSGYYPKEVLKRDGPKVFKKGTHMLWDHPTAQEESDRPEGSLRNLAGVLSEDAQWMDNGPAGVGLYAPADVMKGYEESVNSLASHIGVSIRAAGLGRKGQVAGKPTKIVEELTAAQSVDFVTRPGAGGQVLQLFEAARSRQSIEEERMDVDINKLQADLREAQADRDRVKLDNERLREINLKLVASGKASEYLGESQFDGLTARAKQRVITRVTSAGIPEKDGKLDEPAFKEALKVIADDEAAYLAEAGGPTGRIRGAGHQEPVVEASKFDPAKLKQDMDEALAVFVKEAKNGN